MSHVSRFTVLHSKRKQNKDEVLVRYQSQNNQKESRRVLLFEVLDPEIEIITLAVICIVLIGTTALYNKVRWHLLWIWLSVETKRKMVLNSANPKIRPSIWDLCSILNDFENKAGISQVPTCKIALVLSTLLEIEFGIDTDLCNLSRGLWVCKPVLHNNRA